MNCFQFILTVRVTNVNSQDFKNFVVSIAITCPALSAPSYGIRKNCSGTALEYYNTICLFSCNFGFNGYGSSSRQCKDDGTWSGQDFVCIGKLVGLLFCSLRRCVKLAGNFFHPRNSSRGPFKSCYYNNVITLFETYFNHITICSFSSSQLWPCKHSSSSDITYSVLW